MILTTLRPWLRRSASGAPPLRRPTHGLAIFGGAAVGGLLAQWTRQSLADAAATAEVDVARVEAAGADDGGAPTRDEMARPVPLLARIAKVLAVKNVSLAKVKAVAASNVRYVAYSSDVGEAFRPVVPTWLVKSTYGLAFGYVFCDIGYHVYHEQNVPETELKSVPRCLVHTTVFQLIASLALPAFIIHSGVHAAQSGFKKMGRFTKWGPTVVGLGMIPFLPAFVDYPAEVAIDTAFMYGWPHPRGEHGHAYNLETWEPACPHAHGEADTGGSDVSTGPKQA